MHIFYVIVTVCLQPDGWSSFVKLPHAQHISLPRFTVTLTTKTNRRHHPLEDFLTNANPRTSETVIEIRLIYLRVEAFQFPLSVIPATGGDFLIFQAFLTHSIYKFLSFISSQFNLTSSKPQTTTVVVDTIQCTAFQQSLFSLQTLHSFRLICLIYSPLTKQLVNCHWVYEWFVH